MTEVVFSKIFARYWPIVKGYCYRLTGDKQKSDSIADKILNQVIEMDDLTEEELQSWFITSAYLACKPAKPLNANERRNEWILASTWSELFDVIQAQPEDEIPILKMHFINGMEPEAIAKQLKILPVMVKRRIENFKDRIKQAAV